MNDLYEFRMIQHRELFCWTTFYYIIQTDTLNSNTPYIVYEETKHINCDSINWNINKIWESFYAYETTKILSKVVCLKRFVVFSKVDLVS